MAAKNAFRPAVRICHEPESFTSFRKLLYGSVDALRPLHPLCHRQQIGLNHYYWQTLNVGLANLCMGVAWQIPRVAVLEKMVIKDSGRSYDNTPLHLKKST